jgi:hypothetical protein
MMNDNRPARWFMRQQIQGHLAMWAIRQCPYHRAPRLHEVLEAFEKLNADVFDHNGMVFMSRKRMEDILWQLEKCPAFNAWNVPVAAEAKAQEVFFCSRYDKPAADYDIIDLHALVRNTVHSLFEEADRESAHDHVSFWGKLWSKIKALLPFQHRSELPSA